MKTGIVVLNYNDAKETVNFVNQIKNFKGCMKEILYTIPIVDYDKIDKQKY